MCAALSVVFLCFFVSIRLCISVRVFVFMFMTKKSWPVMFMTKMSPRSHVHDQEVTKKSLVMFMTKKSCTVHSSF